MTYINGKQMTTRRFSPSSQGPLPFCSKQDLMWVVGMLDEQLRPHEGPLSFAYPFADLLGGTMALTTEQRAYLEKLGPELVRQKLLEGGGTGRGAAVRGFGTDLLRGDVEDWLAEKHRETLSLQRRTFWAVIVAAGVGIASLVVAFVTLWFTIWPRH